MSYGHLGSRGVTRIHAYLQLQQRLDVLLELGLAGDDRLFRKVAEPFFGWEVEFLEHVEGLLEPAVQREEIAIPLLEGPRDLPHSHGDVEHRKLFAKGARLGFHLGELHCAFTESCWSAAALRGRERDRQAGRQTVSQSVGQACKATKRKSQNSHWQTNESRG